MTYTDYNGIKQYQRLLSECSYDSEHNEFMCKSELQVIDFDHVKRAYLNDRNFSEEKA
jgi:hypothetical protein